MWSQPEQELSKTTLHMCGFSSSSSLKRKSMLFDLSRRQLFCLKSALSPWIEVTVTQPVTWPREIEQQACYSFVSHLFIYLSFFWRRGERWGASERHSARVAPPSPHTSQFRHPLYLDNAVNFPPQARNAFISAFFSCSPRTLIKFSWKTKLPHLTRQIAP